MTSTYTAAEVLTFIAALGVLVAGLGAVIVNIIVALRTGKQVAEVSAKADVIQGHVNSAASKSDERIVGLEREVALMRGVIAEKRETAALLAQAAAVTLVTAPALVVPPGVSVAVPPVLEQIEANTAATADAVKELKPPP